jgi:hypothetical protein
MRRMFLLLLGIGVVAPTLDAQIVLKGGLSFASVSESEFVPDVKTRTGFAAGISLGLPVAPLIQFRPEALFVQKGGKYSTGGTDETLEINELNFPLMLQLTLPLPGFQPYGFAGPVAEYELDCKNADVDCVDTKSLRWGATVGAGIRFGTLSLEGRYGYTLSELSDDIKSKPRTIMLLVGLNLGH